MILIIQEMHEIDVDAHARLIYNSRQNSPLHNDERTVDGIKTALEQMIGQGEAHAMIVAQDEDSGELLGQLLMWLEWGEIGVVRPWQPIIHPEADQEAVAVALIEHSKKLVETNAKTKLEIWMELTSEQIEAMKSIVEPWYQKSGFVLTAKEYFMDTQYSKLSDLKYSIPKGIEVESMSDISNADLMDIVMESFRSGSDKWVLSMTESQLEGSANAWMKRDDTFINDASIVFKDDGNIIGYNVMRNEDDSIEVGPIGVLPSYRGRGLGRALLLESARRLASKPDQSVWLTVSTENNPAFELYSRLGFKNQYQILIYAWTP